MLYVWWGLLTMLATAASLQAQDRGIAIEPPAADPAVIAMMETLPEQTVKRLRDDPRRFVGEASVLIYGHGRDGAIDAQGLARFIALERAAVRARSMRRLLEADLNNDGAMDAGEVASLADAGSANERGRLRLAHQAADLDRDGRVTMEELRRLGQIEAMAELSDADAAILMAFMGFDSDGDGRVTISEVKQAVAQIAPET